MSPLFIEVRYIMRLIFGVNNLCEVSLTGILCELVKLDCPEVMNTLIYNQEFLSKYIKCIAYGCDIQCNSFVQEPTLLDIASIPDISEVYFYDDGTVIDNYNSSSMYNYLYSYLKKNDCKKINMSDIAVNTKNLISLNDAVYLALYMWRNDKMGELTDAIKKALSTIEPAPEKSDTVDSIKQKMANIGMPVSGFNKVEEPEVEKDFPMNPPVETKPVEEPETVEKTSEDDEDEICCKVQDGNFVFMIPVGTKMNRVDIGGNEFDTLVVTTPDMTKSGLQILRVIKEEHKPEIVRVPITLDKTEKKEKVHEPSVQFDRDIDSLRNRKAELDSIIKEARQNGDSAEVERLRKERRKVRNEINKMV